jgi:hypothetical protein
VVLLTIAAPTMVAVQPMTHILHEWIEAVEKDAKVTPDLFNDEPAK